MNNKREGVNGWMRSERGEMDDGSDSIHPCTIPLLSARSHPRINLGGKLDVLYYLGGGGGGVVVLLWGTLAWGQSYQFGEEASTAPPLDYCLQAMAISPLPIQLPSPTTCDQPMVCLC